MGDTSIVLKTLLQRRYLQSYRAFCREYDRIAETIDRGLVGGWPSRAQFYRWLSGGMIGLPYADHCRILETMFPNWTAKQLFEESNGNLESYQAKDPAVTTQAACEWTTPEESLLAEIPHTLSAHTLNGLWVTCYQFRSSQRTGKALEFHADLAHLTPESDRRVRIKNHPPEPRTNGQPLPFRNDVEAEVVNRHLIGHWKNTSDTRYFGSIHLAILPAKRSWKATILVSTATSR